LRQIVAPASSAIRFDDDPRAAPPAEDAPTSPVGRGEAVPTVEAETVPIPPAGFPDRHGDEAPSWTSSGWVSNFSANRGWVLFAILVRHRVEAHAVEDGLPGGAFGRGQEPVAVLEALQRVDQVELRLPFILHPFGFGKERAGFGSPAGLDRRHRANPPGAGDRLSRAGGRKARRRLASLSRSGYPHRECPHPNGPHAA
jgi:hypothetical protein